MIDSTATRPMEDLACLVGRVLLSLIFIWDGFGKLLGAAATTAFFAKLGLPMPVAAYALAVAIEFGGGLLMLLGLFTRPVALVLLLWCFATALVAHTDFADRNMLIHFMKNVAMAGGFAYVWAFGAGAISLDRIRRRGFSGAKSLGIARG